MSNYLKWNEQTISDFSDEHINRHYADGFVFGRVEKGYMSQTRSLRIDLSKFKLSSENRRVLRKTQDLKFKIEDLPLENYHWSIGKMAKDFYTEKFGDGTFSANKAKELLATKHNFNRLFVYSIEQEKIGYCITLETDDIVHYSYPFYILNSEFNNLGMSMMLHAILYAQEQGKKYIYLGSFQRPSDVYKLQFEGLEWFDGERWNNDVHKLKTTISGDI
ncbi:MAG: hypothetical protein HYV41_05450 [Candidatus Magasanikbacteria bacterium]|nr:hypothetical protein [Candidatus Magasanikbacteria bacterium]